MEPTALDAQRLMRYGSDTNDYTLAIITDEDQASQVTLEDGQIAWRSMLRYDWMRRTVDPKTDRPCYTFEEVPEEQGGRRQLMGQIH